MQECVILWFKRDLRVQDHPALMHATTYGLPILPIYVIEPSIWQGNDASVRHWNFVNDCLIDLRTELARLGASLHVRVGEVVEVLDSLRTQFKVRAVLSHEETGNLATYRRDIQVGQWASHHGIKWAQLPQWGVVRRLASRDDWSTLRDDFMAQLLLPAPDALRGVGAQDPSDDQAPRFQIRGVPCHAGQRGGHIAAQKYLSSFVADRVRGYMRGISSPNTAPDSCSRLSPYLAHGVLSVRMVDHACAMADAGFQTRSFRARLAWRDHFTQKLEDAPDLEARAMHPDLDDLRPRDPRSELVKSWAKGQTGVPMIDAVMRQLHATGWTNFRMRAMIMSFASYQMWLDWRDTGPILARLFTDYDPGIHWPQVQMQSGVTGMNALRVYNPVKQGTDLDPDGVFVKRWLPELRSVPKEYVHQPWTWPDFSRLDYREPLVSLDSRAARDRVYRLRKSPTVRAKTAAVVAAHGSRKSVRRPKKPPNDRQLKLEL